MLQTLVKFLTKVFWSKRKGANHSSCKVGNLDQLDRNRTWKPAF